MGYSFIEHGHVATPQGWRAGVAACGIRYRRQDLALLVSDAPWS
jgi:glutamate N-acetyltransferase/amino-acid N-acetyltransferase